MRLTAPIAALALAILAGGAPDACAEELRQQFTKLRESGRFELDRDLSAVKAFELSIHNTIADPQIRKKLAEEIATRRALGDIVGNKLAKSAPSLSVRAAKALQSPDVIQWVRQDPVLDFVTAGYKLPGRANVEMTNPYGGGTLSDGSGHPGDVKPRQPGKPASPAVLAAEPTSNAPPDPGALPFSISFVVELRMGTGGAIHCSGSLIAKDLVLTARHCMFDPASGKLFDGSDVQVRSVNGGTVVRGRAGNPWVAKPPAGSELFTASGDVALLKLAAPLGSGVSIARVGRAANEALWVIMSGIGVTDQTELQASAWNQSYVSNPQLVEFRAFNYPGDPGMARIPWNDPSSLASSQCDGDSGGPVFVVGRANVPLVIGVLSAANGTTATRQDCMNSKNAYFVNLGHPFIVGMLCPALVAAGSACEASLDYVPGKVALK